MHSLARTLTTGMRRLRGLWPAEADADTAPPAPDISVFGHYAGRARAIGIDRLYLFLSFDCDTDHDAAAALEVGGLLDRLGIAMTFAVPGAQLDRNAEIYGRFAQGGTEFMNHGARPHTSLQDGRYVPVNFYDQTPPPEIAADIRSGHDIVTRVTGRAPAGFRAPHFGCFQQPEQLAQIYRVARSLGYGYCSTTIPQAGLDRGPLYRVDGVVEVPTFGSVRSPTVLVDSWTYLGDKKDRLTDDYADLMLETADVLARAGVPGILSWYADPSHVVGQAPFIRAMEGLARRRIPSLTGAACAALARPTAS